MRELTWFEKVVCAISYRIGQVEGFFKGLYYGIKNRRLNNAK